MIGEPHHPGDRIAEYQHSAVSGGDLLPVDAQGHRVGSEVGVAPGRAARASHEVDVRAAVGDGEHPGAGETALQARADDLERRSHPRDHRLHLFLRPRLGPARQIGRQAHREFRLDTRRVRHGERHGGIVFPERLAIQRSEERTAHSQQVHRDLCRGPDLEPRNLVTGRLGGTALHGVRARFVARAIPVVDPHLAAVAARLPQQARQSAVIRIRGHA